MVWTNQRKRTKRYKYVIIFLIFFYLFIVIGLAANKSDLYANEVVSEEKARKFANDIGAIFKLTSACTSVGIEELFVNLGCKFLDPNFKEDENKKPVVEPASEPVNSPEQEAYESQKNENNYEHERNQSIKLSPLKVKEKKKKKCCW